MSFDAILIANRGEIAIRIARAAADLGIRSVAVYSEDDSASLHTRVADETVALAGIGARAYLDMAALIQVAQDTDCDAIHPGYGFLSEQAEFAALCADAGITFIGPQVRHLTLFGDKASARGRRDQVECGSSEGVGHSRHAGGCQKILRIAWARRRHDH